jgi:hypothetical protein
MAHVFLPNGQRLRLRLFPKPKGKPSARKAVATPGLFAPPDEDAVVVATAEALAAKVMGLVLLNRSNALILERFNQLGIRDWWLTSGCLVQTVWNLRMGRPAEEGIRDYDVVYFSEDETEEAEEVVIRDAARLFADLSAPIEVRNQARVHLWYPEKYGIPVSPLTTASEGILRFPSTTTAVGVKRTGDDFLDVFVPFGLSNVWDMTVKPNRALPVSKIYAEKTARWQKQWPQLVVRPWIVEDTD